MTLQYKQYIIGKQIVFVLAMKEEEKLVKGLHFFLFLKLLQIIVIFADNVVQGTVKYV